MQTLAACNLTSERCRHIEHGSHREVEEAEKCDQANYDPNKEKSLEKGTMTLPLYWGKARQEGHGARHRRDSEEAHDANHGQAAFLELDLKAAGLELLGPVLGGGFVP